MLESVSRKPAGGVSDGDCRGSAARGTDAVPSHNLEFVGAP